MVRRSLAQLGAVAFGSGVEAAGTAGSPAVLVPNVMATSIRLLASLPVLVLSRGCGSSSGRSAGVLGFERWQRAWFVCHIACEGPLDLPC